MANQSKKILFADDEKALRELYKTRLEMEPFDVIFAEDGEEALEKIRKEKPDLILLDIMMPKKDGLAVLEEIKKDLSIPNVPVVMLTVLADEAVRNKAFELGAKYYLVKSETVPLEVVKLIRQELGIV